MISSKPSKRTGTRVNLTLPDELHDLIKRLADQTPGQTVAGFIRDHLQQLTPHFLQMDAALRAERVEDAEGAFRLMRSMAQHARAQADLLDAQVEGYEAAISAARREQEAEQSRT